MRTIFWRLRRRRADRRRSHSSKAAAARRAHRLPPEHVDRAPPPPVERLGGQIENVGHASLLTILVLRRPSAADLFTSFSARRSEGLAPASILALPHRCPRRRFPEASAILGPHRMRVLGTHAPAGPLPENLQALDELARDLRWTWRPSLRALFTWLGSRRMGAGRRKSRGAAGAVPARTARGSRRRPLLPRAAGCRLERDRDRGRLAARAPGCPRHAAAGRPDRVLLGRVRPDRSPSDLRRGPRRPRGRPLEVRERPGAAAGRRRPLLWPRLLPAIAAPRGGPAGGRCAAGPEPTADQRAADAGRRAARRDGDARRARRAHPASVW